jgi:hypothetical protein
MTNTGRTALGIHIANATLLRPASRRPAWSWWKAGLTITCLQLGFGGLSHYFLG